MPLGAIPFPFGMCRICKDRATGIHYGVATCEGCKGFFKRSITRGDKYKCFFGGECDLNPKNRNRCKSCRFQRCLDVGMSVESVRMGRIPKVDKEKALEAFEQSGSDYSKLELEVESVGPGSYDFKIKSKGVTQDGRKTETLSEPKVQLDLTEPKLEPTQSDSSATSPACDIVCKTESEFVEPSYSTCTTESTNSSSFNGSTPTKFNGTMPTKFNDTTPTKFNGTMPTKFNGTMPTKFDGTTPIKQSETMPVKFNEPSTTQFSGNMPGEFSGSMPAKFNGTMPTKFSETLPIKHSEHMPVKFNEQLPTQFTGTMPTKFSGTIPQKFSGVMPLNGDQNYNQGGYQVPQDSDRFNGYENNQSHTSTVTLSSFHSMDYSKLHENGDTANLNNGWGLNTDHCHGNTFKSPKRHFSTDRTMNSQSYVKKQEVDFNNFVDKLNTRNDLFSSSLDKLLPQNENYWTGERQNLSMTGCPDLHPDIGTQSMIGNPVCVPQNTVHQSNTDANVMLMTDKGLFNNHAQDLRMTALHNHSLTGDNECIDVKPFSTYPNNPHNNMYSDTGKLFNKRSADSEDEQSMDIHVAPPSHTHFKDIPSPQTWPYNHTIHNTSQHGNSTVSSNSTLRSLSQQEFERNNFSPRLSQMSDTESHSIENARCPTPVGSMISGDGSGSSCRSTFSPSIIHLLIDEVLKTSDLSSIKERLVSKSKKQKVDKTSMFRVLQLLENSDKFRKRASSLDDMNNCSIEKISTLPESREECLNRFLVDIGAETDNLSVDSFVDIGKGSTLDKSFENLDVEHKVGTDVCAESSTLTLSQDSMVTNNKHSNFHSDDTNAGGNLNEVFDEWSNDHIMSDHVTSSVNNFDKTETCIENMKEIKATLTSMNLAQKILNRFKSEHREKIKLYMDGELHLRVLTDSDEDVKEVYSKLIEGIPGLNDRILGFCNHVPGFSALCSEDRDKLLKRSYYDLWTLSYAEYFRDGKSYWILPSGEIYSAEAMRKILNDEMVDTIFKFGEKFNALNVTDLEMGLLGGVRLTTTDGLELADPQAVSCIQNQILNALAYEVKQNHHGYHTRILKEFFSLEPLMEAVNRLQREIIANFSTKKLEK